MRDGHLPIATTFKFKFNVHVSLPAYESPSIAFDSFQTLTVSLLLPDSILPSPY